VGLACLRAGIPVDPKIITLNIQELKSGKIL